MIFLKLIYPSEDVFVYETQLLPETFKANFKAFQKML